MHRTGSHLVAVVVALAVCVCVTTGLQAAKTKIKADADRKFDFSGVRTWAWAADGAGDVIMARSSKDDPAPVKQRVDPVIVGAVARELGLRGWTPASAGPPDVTMHYYLLVTVGMEAQVFGQFLPAVPEWGVPPFSGGTQSLNIIQRGSLVLDAVSTSLARVVWRGVGQSDIDKLRSDAERDALINDVVHDLVRKLPRKK